jgi:regulator of sigma E protease
MLSSLSAFSEALLSFVGSGAPLPKVFMGIVGLLGFGLLIGIHELGHFFFCKLFNIRTPSFSIGFGPKIISKKIGDTLFTLSALPFGGYVEIAGAAEVGQGDQQEALATDAQSFARKPYYQKLLVLLGGIVFNFLFAYTAFIFVLWTGAPGHMIVHDTTVTPKVALVVENSVAAQHGIRPGDTVTAVNSIPLAASLPTKSAIAPLTEILQTKPEHINLTITRDNIAKTITIDLNENQPSTATFLGIAFELADQPTMPIWSAIVEGIRYTNAWIVKTCTGFMRIIYRKETGELAGPLMIIAMTVKGATQGYGVLLLILAIISINLAVLNLVPIPILDGGQLLFYTLEAVIGRPLPVKIKEYIHIATWILMLFLLLFMTVKDSYRLLWPYLDALRMRFSS